MSVFGRRDGGNGQRTRPIGLTVGVGGTAARGAPPEAPPTGGGDIIEAKLRLRPLVAAQIDKTHAADLGRGELAAAIDRIVGAGAEAQKLTLDPRERRALVTLFLNELIPEGDVVRLDRRTPALAPAAASRANVE